MIYKVNYEGTNYFFDGQTLELYKDKIVRETDELNNEIFMDEKLLKIVTFYVTTQCNANCIYCYEQKSNLIMDKNSADHAIQYLIENYKTIRKVKFFGGEPILNFSIIKYIVEELEKYLDVNYYEIVTNATLVTEYMLNFFDLHSFKMIISLLVSKKFALLKKPVNPSRFRTHPAVPELSALCIILAVFLKGGKNVSADSA